MKLNIEKATLRNNAYRKVIYTVKDSMQLVLMNLPPKTEIGNEIHPYTSQFIRVESGQGVAYISGKRYNLKDKDAIVIPKGYRHNVVNTSSTESLKLYTLYTPPVHKDKLVERNKQVKSIQSNSD